MAILRKGKKRKIKNQIGVAYKLDGRRRQQKTGNKTKMSNIRRQCQAKQTRFYKYRVSEIGSTESETEVLNRIISAHSFTYFSNE